ncbi:MAG: dihydroorotate dehydrogenase [Oscillospiraceae bacterium]|nr:dihydroorotate dehydrogenase [Oscillospiraceae bacterium]
MNRLAVDFAGVELHNPVVLNSGCVGFGREYSELFDLNNIGGICVKGMTLKPRAGNPAPRCAETPSGMLNAVGLQNPGVDAFIQDELPWLRQFRTKVIANISGNHEDEYAELAWKLANAGVDMIEVNISCPNVKDGGIVFGTSPDAAKAVALAVKNHALDAPVVIKLSPNVADIGLMARAVVDGGADAISLINTVTGMVIDTQTKRPVLRNNVGGLSGAAVLPVAVRCVWQAANAVDKPILGMGGVCDLDGALQMLLAGADAVGIGTALFAEPLAAVNLVNDLQAYCEAHDTTIAALTGSVHTW